MCVCVYVCVFGVSTTTQVSLLMKITQMTQNCRKNTGKLKRATSFKKVNWSTVRECPP